MHALVLSFECFCVSNIFGMYVVWQWMEAHWSWALNGCGWCCAQVSRRRRNRTKGIGGGQGGGSGGISNLGWSCAWNRWHWHCVLGLQEHIQVPKRGRKNFVLNEEEHYEYVPPLTQSWSGVRYHEHEYTRRNCATCKYLSIEYAFSFCTIFFGYLMVVEYSFYSLKFKAKPL